MEKISWADRVRNEEVLHRVKEKKNIKRRKKARLIGHILHRNCLVKTHYCRKYKRRNISDGKTGKKT